MKEDSISNHLQKLEIVLSERLERAAAPVQLAFYGGTFTALPGPAFDSCLRLLEKYARLGAVSSARCSTRPDAVNPGVLAELRERGFTMVELGVQSFDSGALAASGRGYSREAALAACALTREAGLELGVQLLPGMPGVSPEVFMADVRAALDSGPAALRFYPCLVLAGSGLADMYLAGKFAPWTLEACLEALAQGWLEAVNRGVPVIRMGLAPEPGLEEHILAGPRHAELGAMIMARALRARVAGALPPGARLAALRAPARCQGFFWGHAGEMRAAWAGLGLSADNLQWHGGDVIEAVADC